MIKNRVEVQIDLKNIIHNYEYIKNIVGNDCRVMAVVKADAYGHGAVKVCNLLEGLGADIFAVACIEEAIILRKSDVKADILILGMTNEDDIIELSEYNLIQTVGSLEYASLLSEKGGSRVHLKIDTGMSRLGMYCHTSDDVLAVKDNIKAISELENIKIEGIFTHFASSDNLSSLFTEKQFAVFTELLDTLKTENIEVGLRHCCNSAAIINYPQMKLDMVRAGIILYGLSPSPLMQVDKIFPAMKLKSRIDSVSKLKKGDFVSYGCTFTAENDMDAAVVSIGYADGFSRALSEKVYVKIGGKKAKIIGKICMDLCVADISDIKCAIGDEVIIFENAKDINALAEILGTINYEIVCMLKQRVKNTYNEK
ncbi:MAG: alanine racemase [Clostridiales bacterium GWF2_36_10]|nr:MAG: alanine racemase [Clostridiales bacterium GWF2_36_10]HAN21578.1 alanine racemase [Clostridiales bacterium]